MREKGRGSEDARSAVRLQCSYDPKGRKEGNKKRKKDGQKHNVVLRKVQQDHRGVLKPKSSIREILYYTEMDRCPAMGEVASAQTWDGFQSTESELIGQLHSPITLS